MNLDFSRCVRVIFEFVLEAAQHGIQGGTVKARLQRGDWDLYVCTMSAQSQSAINLIVGRRHIGDMVVDGKTKDTRIHIPPPPLLQAVTWIYDH